MKLLVASALFSALFGLGVACVSARGVPVEAPVEVAIAPIGSVDGGRPGTNGGSSDRCTLRLAARRIEKSTPSCYLDEHIVQVPGVLHYPCNGDGPAAADFGDHHYVGRIRGGDVELELTSELDWEDGCRWATSAIIRGTIVVRAQPVRKSLSWRYMDRVLTGKECSGACTARSVIRVTSNEASAPAAPRPEEDDDGEGDDEEERD